VTVTFQVSCALTILVFGTSTVALAHHSTAAYATKTITLTNATVTRVVWANPHCVVWFEVKDGRGRVTTWGAETGSPSALSRVGWNRNSLKSGDAIAVELFPAKNGELLDSVFKASPFETLQRK
jgi:hypothetical protein